MTQINNQVIDYINQLRPTLTGRFLYHAIPFRKKIVLKNIETVFGDRLNQQQKLNLAKAFYSHIAKSLKENCLMRFLSPQKIKSKAVVVGAEHVLKAAEKNKGVLILTGHFGNWEFAPIAGIMNFEQYKGRFYFIRKLIGTKAIEKLLFKRYYQAGLNVIPKKNALQQACEALEQQAAVVFVMDQHACIGSKDGIKVDFFNKPAGTYRSLATLARNMEAPVIPAQSYRRHDGQHVLEFYPELEWQAINDRKRALMTNTKRYNEQLEKMILKYPEQWLWMHKRWKL